MGTAVKQHLGEYAQTVARFQGASGGLYKGPAMPLGLLEELVSQVDGIDSSQLLQASTAAVGAHRKKNGFSGFGDFLTDFALEIGSGMVTDYFQRFQEEHDQDEQDREELIENTRHCAEAIEDTVHVANTAITEMLHAACQMVDLLTRILQRRLSPVADVLVPVVTAIGDELIESTHKIIADTCRDRDDTLEKCYEVLEQCCEDACQTPMPGPAPNLTGSCPPGEPETNAQSGGQPAPEATDLDGNSSKQSTEPPGFPLPNLLAEFDLSKSCSGVLGGIGLGVAACGMGILALKAVEWCQENAELINGVVAECSPAESDLPVAPEPPETESEPVPAPAPAPEQAPESGPEPRLEPEPSLDQVPEPEPPAEKIAHLVQHQTPLATETLMSSQPSAEDQVRARKMGDW